MTITFQEYLNNLQPPLSPEDKERAIELHEMRQRRLICHRSALRDWLYEQPVTPVESPVPVEVELNHQARAQLNYLQNKLNHHLDSKPSGFRNII